MKAKTKTLLFIVGAFLLGGITGAVLMRELGYRGHIGRGPMTNPMKEFAERLRLDERQTIQLDSLLELRRERMEVYRKSMLSVRDTARQEIRRLLRPDQVPLFDAYIEEAAQREARYRSQQPPRREQGN